MRHLDVSMTDQSALVAHSSLYRESWFHRRRLARCVTKVLELSASHRVVIDVGASDGLILGALARTNNDLSKNCEYIAVEADRKLTRFCRANLHHLLGDETRWTVEESVQAVSQSDSLVFSFETAEHNAHPASFVDQLFMLSPAVLVVSYPVEKGVVGLLKNCVRAFRFRSRVSFRKIWSCFADISDEERVLWFGLEDHYGFNDVSLTEYFRSIKGYRVQDCSVRFFGFKLSNLMVCIRDEL